MPGREVISLEYFSESLLVYQNLKGICPSSFRRVLARIEGSSTALRHFVAWAVTHTFEVRLCPDKTSCPSRFLSLVALLQQTDGGGELAPGCTRGPQRGPAGSSQSGHRAGS